ncbi:MAG TPA: penicillin-insensitive murein endopeptidase [Candidatus Sulfotelmatobacter sp.]|nr:penicillin-insensitive murein endopeptidase [Candidatus Sulfotelmatobacter sp.]
MAAGRCLLALALMLAAMPAKAQVADLLSALEGRQTGMGQGPTSGPSHAVGGAANGCLAGGKSLEQSGPGWEVLRPARNRYWGTADLLAFLKDRAQRTRDLGTILIGDMSQPRGGRMPSGHGSHQTGVDADILYRLADKPLTDKDRSEPAMDSVVLPKGGLNPKLWDRRQTEMLRIFASDPRVERIFVNPAVKVALCRTVKGDRSWLRRLRPWWGHDEHFHVRINCPVGDMECQSGPPLPEGDGCGDELQSWITSGAWAVKPTGGARAHPPPPLACRDILPAK